MIKVTISNKPNKPIVRNFGIDIEYAMSWAQIISRDFNRLITTKVS